jgi:hypothetical protein
MAGHFLNRPKPAEVVVDGGAARLVTRRESFQDLVRAQELRAEEGIEERLPEVPEG